MKACVLGSGSWGTALACLLAEAGTGTALWARDPEAARAMANARRNVRYLPDLVFPEAVTPTSDLAVAAQADLVVVAIPSQSFRSAVRGLNLRPGTLAVSATKGFELSSLKRMSEVLAEELPMAVPLALSGPNLADEIARGLPASSVVAGPGEAARQVQAAFSSERFRVYTNDDLLGVELGGALKNITALAAGILDGLGLGDNAKAALMTRGLAENSRLGVAMGAEAATFAGLAGMGDLVATCASPLSRNHRLGSELARGCTWEEVRDRLHLTAEGVYTTAAALRLSEGRGVEMPIARQINAILYEGQSAKGAVHALMGRPPRSE